MKPSAHPVLAASSLVALCAGLAWQLAGCVESAPDVPTEQDLKVIRANILTKEPTPKFKVDADLEGKVVYLGMDATKTELRPGEPVTLTHYWKVVKPPGDTWRTFTHVQDKERKNYVNVDHVPIQGKYKVEQWKAGEIIRDRHTITLPASWSSDNARILVGLWKGKLRMKIAKGPADEEGRVVAATFKVNRTARPTRGKRHVATKVSPGKINIDGKLDEPEWAKARRTSLFVQTLTGRPAEQKTWAKVLWDDENLYVAFHAEDTDIWGSLKNRDDKLWTEEAVELFLDPGGRGQNYHEIQVSPNNVIFDSFLPRYRQNQNDWDSGLKSAVHVDGTVNKRDDTDKSWTVELAIPLKNLKGATKAPAVGDVWRMNMFRMDKPKDKAQTAQGWSPPLVGDFHALNKFGELVFGDENGKAQNAFAGAGKVDMTKLSEVIRRTAAQKSAEQAARLNAARAAKSAGGDKAAAGEKASTDDKAGADKAAGKKGGKGGKAGKKAEGAAKKAGSDPKAEAQGTK